MLSLNLPQTLWMSLTTATFDGGRYLMQAALAQGRPEIGCDLAKIVCRAQRKVMQK
jgi:hypothetical protein